SHPADFTPDCTTEMGKTARLAQQFAARNTKPLGLSTDTVPEHLKWIEDVNDTQKTDLQFPIVADADLKVARQYDMIHPAQSDTAAVRSVFIIPLSITGDDAVKAFPQGWEAPRPYLRLTSVK